MVHAPAAPVKLACVPATVQIDCVVLLNVTASLLDAVATREIGPLVVNTSTGWVKLIV